jgi:hypothetical protein
MSAGNRRSRPVAAAGLPAAILAVPIAALVIALGAVPAAAAEPGQLLEWLAAPADPSRAHDLDAAVAWHGRLMVLAWVVLAPVGILAARFFKIMPGQDWPNVLDNQAWWNAHRACQYAAAAAALGALWLVLTRPGGPHGAVSAHAVAGWTTILLLGVQLAGGWLRGSKGGPTAPAAGGSLAGDHYDMTRRRLAFEYLHKSAGYLAVGAALVAVVLGLNAVNAPRWMWAGLAFWWGGAIGVFATLQARGWTADTYQAIWGPDTGHPGNRRRPIGWGVRRRSGGA